MTHRFEGCSHSVPIVTRVNFSIKYIFLLTVYLLPGYNYMHMNLTYLHSLVPEMCARPHMPKKKDNDALNPMPNSKPSLLYTVQCTITTNKSDPE